MGEVGVTITEDSGRGQKDGAGGYMWATGLGCLPVCWGSGSLSGWPAPPMPGWAARRARVAAQARHYHAGRASPGTEQAGLGPGQKYELFGRAVGMWVF